MDIVELEINGQTLEFRLVSRKKRKRTKTGKVIPIQDSQSSTSQSMEGKNCRLELIVTSNKLTFC